MYRFKNRIVAGQLLAEQLMMHERDSPMLIALPRGGVEVGYPIAKKLTLPLEVLISRKISSPSNPELGIGAVAENDIVIWDTDMAEVFQLTSNEKRNLQIDESKEVERRVKLYRSNHQLPLMTNKTAILVDDGLATGVTAHAAILALKAYHPKKIIFAVPVCAQETEEAIGTLVDKVICLQSICGLESIGKYYEDFHQVSDEEVLSLLQKANRNISNPVPDENGFEQRIIW